MIVLTNGDILAATYSSVFTIGPDGSQLDRFDSGPGHLDTDLAVAADGKLLFTRHGVGYGALVALRGGKVEWELVDRFTMVDEGPLALPDGGICIAASNRVVRLNPDGSIRWTHTAATTLYHAPSLAPDGGLLFAEAMRGSNFMVMLNEDGSLRWRLPSDPGFGVGGPAFARDGTFYWGRDTNITLAAFSPAGAPLWQLKRRERSLSTPVVGQDETIYLTARSPARANAVLLAVSPVGSLKWEFALGSGHALDAPVIAADGTLYLVTSDRWVRAIKPDGQLKWHYRIASKPSIDRELSWEALRIDLRTRWGLTRNDLHGPPVLGPDGTLYVNFGHTGSIYAFDVGGAAAPAGEAPRPKSKPAP